MKYPEISPTIQNPSIAGSNIPQSGDIINPVAARKPDMISDTLALFGTLISHSPYPGKFLGN